MSEVARIRPARGRAIVVPPAAGETIPIADSLLNLIPRYMEDPTIDVGKLEVLLRIQQQIIENEERREAAAAVRVFNRAKSEATREMEPIVRDAPNTQTNSWYARLETIDAAIRPIYQRHGFDMSFGSEPGGELRIVCELSHAAGHSRSYGLPATLDVVGPKGTVNKTPLHGLGSTISYLRRYLTCMVWNLVLVREDNDGNRTAHPPTSDGELVGAKQLAELYALLRDCSKAGTPKAQAARRLLDAVELGGLRSLDDLPAGEFDRVRTILIQKRGRLREAAARIQAGDIK